MVYSFDQNENERSLSLEAEFFLAIGNACRLKMLRIMMDHEISVGELAKAIGLSQSATSQHLAKLNAAELVERRRASQNIYYKVISEPVRQILKYNERRRMGQQ